MSIRGKIKFVADVVLNRELPMLKAGDRAPEFDAIDHHGKPIRLSDFQGKNVVLWFFPKADTPG